MFHNLQENHINRARASLRQAISWYGSFTKPGQSNFSPELADLIKPETDDLKITLQKLDQKLVKIAAFGLVSRGKSAVLNALSGQKTLQTGPLNGVTQYPYSIRWHSSDKIEVELIDTPGLDEISGESREKMAKDIASQADLILFIVSGDITNTEYQSLKELYKSSKPLILVFNKIDLYPDADRTSIYRNLQKLSAENLLDEAAQPDEVVLVAAEPAPIELRIEHPDGKIDYEWEIPAPQIDELRRTVLSILNHEGRSLIALNALVRARKLEEIIAEKIIEHRHEAAEKMILQFAKYKAVMVGLNPIAVIDIFTGSVMDLILIRSLSKLYGLPATSFEAGKILQQILLSSGGLLLVEISISLLFGMGNNISMTELSNGWTHIASFIGSAIAQVGVASYGAHIVGKSAQTYLLRGSSWGQFGASTIIQEIITQVPKNSITSRFIPSKNKVGRKELTRTGR